MNATWQAPGAHRCTAKRSGRTEKEATSDSTASTSSISLWLYLRSGARGE